MERTYGTSILNSPSRRSVTAGLGKAGGDPEWPSNPRPPFNPANRKDA